MTFNLRHPRYPDYLQKESNGPVPKIRSLAASLRVFRRRSRCCLILCRDEICLSCGNALPLRLVNGKSSCNATSRFLSFSLTCDFKFLFEHSVSNTRISPSSITKPSRRFAIPGWIIRLVESRDRENRQKMYQKPGTPLWRHCPITILILKNRFGLISKILNTLVQVSFTDAFARIFVLLFQLLVAVNPKDL